MTYPLTPRAKKTLENAKAFANELGHSYIGSEHLLVGLLRLDEGVAKRVLQNRGVKTEEVVAMINPPSPESEIAGLRARIEALEAAMKKP